ncbi:MAG TPA: PepSY domain-containing protein [Planctomycetota bacterium]|nr:PepSY domain-containing protein [Planctomycetota bacterium]
MDFSRFEELLQGWHDGDAGPNDLREFEALLKSDPIFRKELVHSMLLEAGLHRRFAAEKGAEVQDSASSPSLRRRSWEAAAALIVVAVSLFAVGRLLLRSETPVHHVLSGEVWALGAPVHVLREGQGFEVRGLAPATVQLKDGTKAILDAGSAGSIPPEGSSFELRKGSASFTSDRAFRLTTPVGSVATTGGQFWVLLRPSARKLSKELAPRPELVVETTRGSVAVDAWETRGSVSPGQRRIFGAPLPGGETDYARLLDRTTLTLSAAIARASAAGPGIPVRAELEEEDGRVAYSIGLAVQTKVHERTIDPKSGQVLQEEDDDEDRSRIVASVTMSLEALVDKILESVPGRAVEAEFELKSGRLRAEIKILGPEGLKEYKADAATGQILSSESKGDDR